MSKIGKIEKKTDTPYLNFYEVEAHFRDGRVAPYYVASRAKSVERLKAVSHRNDPDGVILYGVYGEQQDKVVLIRQYRYPLGGYVYEFPAGLVEPGEDMLSAGIREMKEETGLDAGNAEGGYLFTYKRENPGEGDNYFVDVYRFVMDIDDKDLHLQTEETDGYMFATPDQIREFAEQGIFLHYDSIKQAFEM